ncbi:fructose-bisphosphate aldolase class I, partial [candidate division WWE3 bacterium]|nr:fructose-bisphosphate aldolase class I [candidate division WWE3 bacterium]
NRRLYREVFLAAEGIEEYLSGVIMYDETTRERSNSGVNYVELLESKGIIPGIKVDKSTTDLPDFPDEFYTQGLDGLEDRLLKYRKSGLRFAKWRSVIIIGDGLPTEEAVERNAADMALYASMCQQAGIVPIVEPEVLRDGEHDLARAEEVTQVVLQKVFEKLADYKVDLDGLLLKTSMVVPGSDSMQRAPEEIAAATVRVLRDTVPDDTAGVVFLSGGQTPEQATENLNEISEHKPLPWPVTFSYARAIQQEALQVWRGKDENMPAAREAFINRLKLEQKALVGDLN